MLLVLPLCFEIMMLPLSWYHLLDTMCVYIRSKLTCNNDNNMATVSVLLLRDGVSKGFTTLYLIEVFTTLTISAY